MTHTDVAHCHQQRVVFRKLESKGMGFESGAELEVRLVHYFAKIALNAVKATHGKIGLNQALLPGSLRHKFPSPLQCLVGLRYVPKKSVNPAQRFEGLKSVLVKLIRMSVQRLQGIF
jgi:hypothetical protein